MLHIEGLYAPSTIWNRYSMLKTTIQRNDNINIEYPKLLSQLKKNAVGFNAKKTKVFLPDEIRRFFTEADDLQHLCSKVNIGCTFASGIIQMWAYFL